MNILDCEATEVAEVFPLAFKQLCQPNLRNDYVYRNILTQKILLGRHSLKTATMLSEFRVGTSKADLVILNGTATAYEIKSERDTLNRLKGQISDYQKVFAKSVVVCGIEHIQDVVSSVPSSVGILTLNQKHGLSTYREATDCAERVDTLAILDSLRTTEAISLLKTLGREAPEAPNTLLRAALTEEYKLLDPKATHEAMVSVLKKTRDLKKLSDLVSILPFSLQALALSHNLKKEEVSRLTAALRTPLAEAQHWA